MEGFMEAEYNRLTKELRMATDSLVETQNKINKLELVKEEAWEALDYVILAYVIHEKEHNSWTGYCGFRGCSFYEHDDHSKSSKVIWSRGMAERYLEQAKGILKVITLDEALNTRFARN